MPSTRYLILALLLCVNTESVFTQASAGDGGRSEPPPQRMSLLSGQRREAIVDNLLYNEGIYVVSNFSAPLPETAEFFSIKELLQKETEGFYFYIRKGDADGKLLLRKPDGSFYPFIEALKTIKLAMDDDSTRVMTLFLDFYVDIALESSFEEAGLSSYLFEYNPKDGWPSLKQMVGTGKRLVVFEIQKHLYSPGWLHYLYDYTTGIQENLWGGSNNDLESFDQKMGKSLRLFTGFKTISQPMYNTEEDINSYARQTPYLIEFYKRSWISEGKIPNFILVDKYHPWLDRLLMTLRSFHIIQGSITYNRELVNYANWEGLSNVTGGKFSFPLEASGRLLLQPVSPGYEITPKFISVENPAKKVFIDEFKAHLLNIEDNLEINLPLDNEVKDLSYRRNNSISKNIEFTYDAVRGWVASLDAQSRIDLPEANHLRMTDHDFTVAVWLQVPKYLPDKRDYCILGTRNNAYQRGLHFLIRNHKPYMGFFNNDLEGNTIIEPGKWYHVTWRYNKRNGEQSIYVNGRLDAISFGRPPYLGRDSLYIGFADFNMNSSFAGMLDNFFIWSRVLGDKEILGLSNQLINIEMPSAWQRVYRNVSPLLWIIPPVVCILLIALTLYRMSIARKRKEKKTIGEPKARTSPDSHLPEIPLCNCIHLFGDFYVSDKNGGNITSLFTPKLKQLFLLILLYSRDKSGITNAELTQFMWGDDSIKDTKSLRSVSILKLRKILERMDKAEIVFNANKYLLVLSDSVYCDYLVCSDWLQNRLVRNKKEFEQFFALISRGEVFKGESFAWLDDYKGYVSNRIVDVVLKFIPEYPADDNAEMIIRSSDQVLLNDPTNEEALGYKVRALIKQNNYQSAKYTYTKFCATYKEMYNEAFPVKFEKIISFR
ncbi:MAG: hypothetical protein LBH58_06025 [Tannerellaceae bacterium]|jgi:DNA-binding SARP family transcriptional activator|nr:hypothetical protein [Tannerellaceae bacterium]